MPFSTGCPESSKLAVEFIMKISELQNNSGIHNVIFVHSRKLFINS